MIYGIRYRNSFNQERSAIQSAIDIDTAKSRFIGQQINNFTIDSIDTIGTDISECELLYQSKREIVLSESRNCSICEFNGEINLIINNVLSYSNIVFANKDIHWDGTKVVVMVCIHNGLPNWLY